jgi:hypothetical protein
VIIYNQTANATAGPPGMAGDGINDAFVLIPTVSIRRADGLSIVAQLAGGVSAGIGVDLTVRAGAHGGFVSSVAHLTNQWAAGDLYSGAQKGKIQSAAAKK